MYYYGSQRKLLGNSIEAMMAAVEIYNKPAIEYREECFVILLVNAWELFLKAVLSKNRKSIYYNKKRGEPYRTYSWQDAFRKAETLFPSSIQVRPVRRNLELIGTFRDNSIHFYNASDFRVVLYSLAQTCLTNYRDCLDFFFNQKLEHKISWQLLPIGIGPPLDPLAYISASDRIEEQKNKAIKQYLSELAEAVEEVENAGDDTGRLLTIFSVKLESVKKIEKADVVVGVERGASGKGPLAIVKIQDPNITHPLRQTDVLKQLEPIHGINIHSYRFQAIVWKYGLKETPRYCWKAAEGILTKYSNEIVVFIKRLTKSDIEGAISDYTSQLAERRKRAG